MRKTSGQWPTTTREGRTARQLAIAEKEKTRTAAELIIGRGRAERGNMNMRAVVCPGKMGILNDTLPTCELTFQDFLLFPPSWQTNSDATSSVLPLS